jgi:hypothetical protein
MSLRRSAITRSPPSYRGLADATQVDREGSQSEPSATWHIAVGDDPVVARADSIIETSTLSWHSWWPWLVLLAPILATTIFVVIVLSVLRW